MLEMRSRLATHGCSLLGQDNAELTQQATQAIDRGSALLDEALTHSVHAQPGLLVLALDRDEVHVRSLHCLADRRGVGRVVLAQHATYAVRRDELGCHQAHCVTVLLEETRPVVS